MFYRSILIAIGLSLLVLSPPLLDKIHTGNDYLTFGILSSFIAPHLQGVAMMSILLLLLLATTGKYLARSRYLSIFVYAALGLFMFRGFFSVAGISPQTLAGTVQQKLSVWGVLPPDYSATNFRLAGVIAILLVAVYLLARFKPSRRFAYSAAAFGWTLAIITLVRVIPVIQADSQFDSIRTAMQQPSDKKMSDRRVVWVLFDEFDYDVFFANRNPALSLPNLDRLQRTSISAENATSPADATLISIPALTIGSMLAETRGDGQGQLRVQGQGATTSTSLWHETANIFSDLKAKNKTVSVLGFYHPYCNVFPFAQPCDSYPMFHYPGWWWGYLQAARILPGVDYLVKRNHLNGGGFDDVFRRHLEKLPIHLAADSTALSFFHFNVPHPPGERIGKTAADLLGYEHNGLAVDLVAGIILDKLEAQSKSQEILLIVSTDHWLRLAGRVGAEPKDVYAAEFGKPRSDIRKIPLIIHRIGETSPATIPHAINTVHTAALIGNFLEGKLTDQSSIVAWWRNKPYVEPVISGRQSAF